MLLVRDMETLTIHNWDKWQSYRSDRGQPPWIKIHRECMRHIEWVGMSDAQRGQLVAIWLLAADRNGVIPASPAMIRKLCHLDTEPDLNYFIEHGFIDGVIVAAECRQSDSPEKSREETEKRQRKSAKRVDVFPEIENRQLVEDWLKIRTLKKLAVTETALKGFTDEVKKSGWSLEDALTKCCHEGWGGFKASWIANEQKPQADGKFDMDSFLKDKQ